MIRTESDVVEQAAEHLRVGFAPDDVTISLDPHATAPANALAVPLYVKGRPAG